MAELPNSEIIIVLGIPKFWSGKPKPLDMAIGQYELGRKTRRKICDQKRRTRRFAREWHAILVGMAHLGIEFRIAVYRPEDINEPFRQRIEAAGLSFICFPEAIAPPYLRYPRDIAVVLNDGHTVLFPDDGLLDSDQIERVEKRKLLSSNIGQGGQALLRRDVALCFEWEVNAPEGKRYSTLSKTETSVLEKSGYRVGVLPNTQNQYRRRIIPDNHIDRTCGLLEDSSGQLHLIADPNIHSLKLGERRSEVRLPEETLAIYQEVCDRLGIVLHMPSKISVLASTCFVQFPNGQVLMTGGDDEVAEIVMGIVGIENVFTTLVPIEAYPAFRRAGVRCMIGELPSLFDHLSDYLIDTT